MRRRRTALAAVAEDDVARRVAGAGGDEVRDRCRRDPTVAPVASRLRKPIAAPSLAAASTISRSLPPSTTSGPLPVVMMSLPP
jgi:hypothetical protein